jgi:hypothetical protein
MVDGNICFLYIDERLTVMVGISKEGAVNWGGGIGKSKGEG